MAFGILWHSSCWMDVDWMINVLINLLDDIEMII